nr:PREDICTED: testis- and ovary-specific PAZ domain-containing protein 1 isoform X2 [Paralichthys olivaceus]
MFPSSSRVKLNRVALKDAVGPQPHFPRRRRVSRSPTKVSAEPEKPEASEGTCARDGGDEPVQSWLARRGDPGDAGAEEPEHCCGGSAEETGRRKVMESCRESDGEEFQPEGPDTRDKNRNTHPSPTGSQGCSRRTVSASSCGPCGDCEYISPQRKTLVKKEQKSSSPGPEQSADELKINKGNPVTDASKEIVTWVDQYAKVTLCDIAQKCHPYSHNCGYVLPDVLKNKVVHCFKHDMTDVQKDPGTLYELIGAEISSKKRTKLGYSMTKESMPSDADSKNISCNDTARTYFIDKEKTCSEMSGNSQSCLELTFGSCSTHTSTMKENCVHARHWVQIDKPRESDAAQMSSQLFCPMSEADADEPESSTCQRVRVYSRKQHFSCARTYMSWPFSNTSRTLTANTGTTACQAEHIHPSARNNSDSSINQIQSASLSSQTNDVLPNAPAETSSDTTHKVSHHNEEKEDVGCITAKRNGKRDSHMSSYSSDSNNMEFEPHFMDAQESFAGLLSDSATLSTSSQCDRAPGTDTALALSMPANGPDTDSSTSTPSPSVLGLNDWETTTTASPTSFLFTHSGLSPHSVFLLEKVKAVESAEARSACTSPVSSVKRVISAVEKPLFHSEETQMTSCPSPTSPFFSLHNCDSCHSCQSFLLLPQGRQEGDKEKEILTDRSPPKLEPYYNQSPMNHNYAVTFGRGSSSLQNITKEKCGETNSNEFLLPPLLSPVASPQWHLLRSSLPQRQCCLEEEMKNDNSKHTTLPGYHMPQIGEGDHQNGGENFDRHQHEGHANEEMEGASSKFKTMNDDFREGSQDNIDYEDDVEQSDRSLSEPCSSPSSDEGSPSETVGSERHKTEAEAAGGTDSSLLDEFTAYERDILLVNVIPDPELFENLPEESLLKLGPTRVSDAPKTRPAGAVKTLLPRWTPTVIVDLHNGSPDIKEESNSRPWRPQCNSNLSTIMGHFDANNNMNWSLERSQPVQAVNPPHNISAHMILRNGPLITNRANMTEIRRHKSTVYCRQYFSESLSCGFKMCRFKHVPVDGDEKFCVETVMRFIQNPTCVQKAGAVFTGYYQNNPPGVFFSMPVFVSLLWSLLKACMVSDILSVLSVSLAHKIAPGHEFLLALFDLVREKGLVGFLPQLMRLTFKMASGGLVLSLDWFESIKITPEFQQAIRSNSPVSVTANLNAPFPEYLNLAQSIVEIELCTKQEDWRRMGKVFRSICQSSHHPNQVEQISGRIAIALLSESKDKLSLPFATFAETVCPSEGDTLIQSFFGRIGVSLMLRYHKTHQWAKGRRVVEMLSLSKVRYSTLKGLFGNEDGASRCYLVTVATELFLLSGSVEGALNTLRENKWFLSSHSWPCEPADLDSRKHVLMRLAEKTSHRDTLEVLCNLPGIKMPNDLIDISRYGPLFDSHLRVCMDRQVLPVASDTVDFMLSHNLAVDHAMLQILFHKLGKQNHWLRAREVFRHSLSVGYYPGVSAPPGFMALIVPCHLGEVELALAFEMFIAVNAAAILQISETTTSCLSITLKR